MVTCCPKCGHVEFDSPAPSVAAETVTPDRLAAAMRRVLHSLGGIESIGVGDRAMANLILHELGLRTETGVVP